MPQVAGNTDPEAVFLYIKQREGRLAYDIGANGGYLASIIAKNFETVLAIEPCHESYFHMVERDTPNVKPLMVAASDHDGSVFLRQKEVTESMGELVTGGDPFGFWGDERGTREVPCYTLDTLANDYGYPDFIKIDTEGHEVLIMDGAHKVFVRRPKFCIEIHSPENGEYISDFLGMLELPFSTLHHPGYRDKSRYYGHYWIVG